MLNFSQMGGFAQMVKWFFFLNYSAYRSEFYILETAKVTGGSTENSKFVQLHL